MTTLNQATWAIVVLPRWLPFPAFLDMLKGRAAASAPLPGKLLVFTDDHDVKLHEGALARVLGSTRFSAIFSRSWPLHGPGVALGDGAGLRLRHGPDAPVIQLRGSEMVNHLLRTLQAREVAPHPGDPGQEDSQERNRASGVLRRLQPRQDTVFGRLDARLGSAADAPPVASVRDEVRGYLDLLLRAIVDPAGSRRAAREGETAEKTPLPRAPRDSQTPLSQTLPELAEARDVLVNRLSVAPTAPWCTWSGVPDHQLLSLLMAVVNEPSRRLVAGHLVLMTTAISEHAQRSTLPECLEVAVTKRGWIVTVAWGTTGDEATDRTSLEQAAALRARIRSPHLRLRRFAGAVSAHALVLGDIVFLSAADWLCGVLEPERRPSFGFAIESLTVAETLRAVVLDASEPEMPGAASRPEQVSGLAAS